MDTKNLLLVSLPIIAAILSSYLTYFFSMKSKKAETILKFKEEKYKNLLILMQAFVGQTATADMKKKFFEEQYSSWLYSSDEVVKAIQELIDTISKYEKGVKIPEGQTLIGNIVLAMRKDLLGKTNLTPKDFRYTDIISRN
ncbi:MAG: hypothetical protein PVH88_20200 [Ignavibacteria bacterium]|jgi:hypothetical protein